jgi:hypothetical protein
MYRLAVQFRFIGIERLRRLLPNSGQTESRRSPNTWRCLERNAQVIGYRTFGR